MIWHVLVPTKREEAAMALVEQMRVARDGRNDAVRLIATVCRDRPWREVTFRVKNGITEFYVLLDTCVGQTVNLPTGVDVGVACSELVRTQRNYIVYNEQIQVSLASMLLKLSMRKKEQNFDACIVDAVRETLRETILPFLLFIHETMCTRSIDAVRKVLFDVVFDTDTSVLEQWSAWRTEERIDDGGVVMGDEKRCPITLDRVVDGVIASDGYLYERSALLTHMTTRRESPMTREYLDLDVVTFTNGC